MPAIRILRSSLRMSLHCCATVAIVFSAFSLVTQVRAQEFYGEVILKPMADGVLMEVQRPFGFIDARNRKWEVPANYRTDGAAIPRPLWSIVGSPFTGQYLPAAIVHDFYCDLKSRDWKEVHNAFYEAMIAKAVDMTLAKIIFFGVYRFGPRWVVDKNFTCPQGIEQSACMAVGPGTVIKEINVTPAFDEKEFTDAAREIQEKGLSLSKIRATADNGFFREGVEFEVKGLVSREGKEIRINERNRLDAVENSIFLGKLSQLLQ